jgi:hypothetical protein
MKLDDQLGHKSWTRSLVWPNYPVSLEGAGDAMLVTSLAGGLQRSRFRGWRAALLSSATLQ